MNSQKFPRRAVALIIAAAGFTPTAAYSQEPRFTSIQPELFAVAGSLSNAWGDYDNDGDLDLAVSIKGGEIRLYRNDGGEFTSVGQAMGLPQAGDEIRGLSWGDYDADGDLDLLGGSNVLPTPSRTYVYRNDRTAFVEVAEEIGLAIPGRTARQSNWIDHDNDGDLDLYAADRSGVNQLYVNENGQFTPAPRGTAPFDPRRTVGACWFDLEGDGDLDLFLANQSGDSDALWRNDRGSYTDIAPETGMDQTLRTLSDGGVGCAVGDYDNDGDFDLYVATYGDNLLYRNEGGGVFTEVGTAAGVTEPHSTVGAAWGDYDNDGLLDLIAVGYENVAGEQEPAVVLYRNIDGSRFERTNDFSEVINVGDHGVEWIDYDGDGDIDLSLTDGYGAIGGHFLLRNDLKTEARTRGLSVLVLDGEGRFLHPGAEVRLYNAAGDVIASRLVPTGGGYNTQSATAVHFGLATADEVTVEVTFMGASGPQTQVVGNVAPEGQLLKVHPGATSRTGEITSSSEQYLVK